MTTPDSLITQVSRDDPSAYSAPAPTATSTTTIDAPADNSKSQPEKAPAANTNRNFFQKVFCCMQQRAARRRRRNQTEDEEAVVHELQPAPILKLLPEQDTELKGLKCLVLDLDETLVHSSFKPVATADFVIPVEIADTVHQVYILKRPGVDLFLEKIGPLYEVVVFTASLAKYADPVLDLLDKHHHVSHRLFREHCVQHEGNFVKDLSLLGRPMHSVLIVDNSPMSYALHPEHAVPVNSWFDDDSDTELLDLIPFLEGIAKNVHDVRDVLDPSWIS